MSTNITLTPATSVAELAARHAAVTIKLSTIERQAKAKIEADPASMTARMLLVAGTASGAQEWLKALDITDVTNQLEDMPGQAGRFALFGRAAESMKDEGASIEEVATGMFQAMALMLAHIEALVNRVEDEFSVVCASNQG